MPTQDEKISQKFCNVDETFIFVFLITAVGGFVNAYSYFVCGGVFASGNTGNMIMLGVATHTRDWDYFLACLIPIIFSILGSALSRIIWHTNKTKTKFASSNRFILLEIFILFIIGLLPETVPDNYINIILSFVCGYQVGTFRLYNGTPHNNTNCAGNLRTMGYFVGDIVINRFSKTSIIATGKYLAMISSYVIGSFLGAVTSDMWGKYASFVGCFMLFMMIIVNLIYRYKYQRMLS